MFACDVGEGSTLEVAVRVEPAVQVAIASPAQVLVGFGSSGSGYVVFRVGFLCRPPAAPFVTTAHFSDSSGGATVDAWLVPLGAGTPVACGPLPLPEPVAPVPPRFAGGHGATAQLVVLGGCGAGEAHSATL